MMSKNERNFWLDWIMFFIFLICSMSGIILWLLVPNCNNSIFAGIDQAVWLVFHECVGFLGLVLVTFHIVLHWNWLKTLRGRPLKLLKKSVQINRIVDRLIWFAFLFSNISGILAWWLFSIMAVEASRVFNRIHLVTSIAWLVLLSIHLVLHQKWIVSAIQRYFSLGLSTYSKSNLRSGQGG
jgi:hypothetical protein